ncbi:hypothetical protein [Roseomonas xinghualingensis]|uniref:hypothetical protein n=1 Tax=Roseomonas xinghualingensis TaxID=2986475 RepID=UPI0021F1BFE2|nr:hypothetical protein [Roseomonas sp. SXEYE001]MCV4208205.1 hypothetical protein [Roseomonas sp. SXEYE001]
MLYLARTDSTATSALVRRAAPPPVPGVGPERWLQERLYNAPGLLLAGAASPRHARLRSVCIELPLRDVGYADWFGVTPEGEIALAEVKLGTNAEARREVVAQALEYHAALRRLSFSSLEEACLRAERTTLTTEAGLYERSGAGEAGLAPDEFVERVEANLRRGSSLLAIVLDRMPERLARLVAETIADQPALPFDVSLIEVGLYDAPDGGIVLAPVLRGAALAVTRAVVRLEGPLAAEPVAAGTPERAARPGARSFGEFLAALDAVSPGVAVRFGTFLETAARSGVTAQVARSLILRLAGVNIGSLGTTGELQVYATEPAREAGWAAFEAYLEAMSAVVGVPLVSLASGERRLRCDLTALLDRQDGWIEALLAYRDAVAPDAPTTEPKAVPPLILGS